MLTRLAAQDLVDGLAAVALGASVLVVARRGGASPLRWPLSFSLGGLCLFLGVRAAAGALGSPGLNLFTLEIVSLLPLAALVLAEGMLRRHAPWLLKVLVTAGAGAMCIALIVSGGRGPVSTWGLGVYVIAALSAVTGLLLTRDRASLSRQENASVGALIASGVLLTALSLTDFLPGAPVGLSGVGAAGLAFVIGAGASDAAEARRVLASLAAAGLAAAIFALAVSSTLSLSDPVEQVRLGAVILALLLSAAVVFGVHRRAEGGGFARALADADLTSLDAFLGSLAAQPLIAGLRVVEGPQLADYDAAGLARVMAARAVWTPAEAAGVSDELGDLMARTEATHAVMIAATPLRIALFTLPGVGPAGAAETNLALFHKLAMIAAREPPCA